jgi:hypothetical protein
MIEEHVLVLCPPNMTAPQNGPNGFLGDRVHQLPAVALATRLYSHVYVWPEDPVTREMFQFLPVNFIQAKETDEVTKQAAELKITRSVCLYTDPSTCVPERAKDCETVKRCHEIAKRVTPTAFSMPEKLEPKGQVPLWRRLYATVRPKTTVDLHWPSVPFLMPGTEHQSWAVGYVNLIAGDKPILIISPLSGAPKGVVDNQWWLALAKCFNHGVIIVPVHEAEVTKARAIFGDLQNVVVIAANIAQTAALAAFQGAHVLGIDGGKMNVLAASKPTSVLCLYGEEWPASAWAMPNVVVRDSNITPEEAIMAVP